jgi:hypothetical protein
VIRSYALTLIALALLLGNAHYACCASADNERREHHERASADNAQNAQQRQQEPSVPLSAFQTSQAALFEALRAIRAKDEAYAQHQRPYKDNWDKAGVIADYLLFLIGCLYTYYAWRQWGAIKKQGAIAERVAADGQEVFRLEQRPWLVPTGAAQLGMPDGTIPEGQMLPMRFTLKNTGNTPALNITIRWVYDITEAFEPWPNDELSNTRMVNLGAVGPGVDHQIPLDLGPFTGPQRAQVLDGTYRLTVRGCIEYRGHIKTSEPYMTKFCLCWLPLPLTGEGRFVLTGPYNDCT